MSELKDDFEVSEVFNDDESLTESDVVGNESDLALLQYLVQIYNNLSYSVIGTLKDDKRVICLDGENFSHLLDSIRDTTKKLGEVAGIDVFDIPKEEYVSEEEKQGE